MNDIEIKYRKWLTSHQEVFALFEKFALEMNASKRRFSISMLTERVRWEVKTTWSEDSDGYKINNNYRAYITRDLLAKYPSMTDLIETRILSKRKVKQNEELDWGRL